ncbi:MAG: flagellar filament capping protein FliD [Leptospiraceae bacterium]|nr:flagellar filament capping protein FliD [Leptospiraceae bacterium]
MDLGSGINTQETIQKLLELERRPLARLEQQNQINEIKIKAWGDVRKLTTQLEDRSRKLHSFTGSFAIKDVVSSDPGAITGMAAPHVGEARQELEVKQLATHHRIHSDALSTDAEISAGTFTIEVNGTKVDFEFKGGPPNALLQLLRQRGSSIFDASTVNPGPDRTMISMQSKVSGERGAFQFTDPDGLLQQIGLAGTEAAVGRAETIDLKFDSNVVNKFSLSPDEADQLEAPRFDILNNGDGMILRKGAVVYKRDFAAGDKLSMVLIRTARPEAQNNGNPNGTGGPDSASDSAETNGGDSAEHRPEMRTETISVGPDINVRIGDVELRGENLTRERQVPVAADADENQADESQAENADANEAGETDDTNRPTPTLDPDKVVIGVVYNDNGTPRTNHRELELDKGQIQFTIEEMSGGRPVQGVYFIAPGADLEISHFQVSEQPDADSNQLAAKNETTPAQDAVMDINGIEVRRPQNKEITDVMDGVSLDLNRPTNGPVEVRVQTRNDEIVQEIVDWVQAYNELVNFTRELSRSGRREFTGLSGRDVNPDDEEQPGLFSTDSTLRQLLANLRSTVSSVYPSTRRPGFRVLADIGISSGDVGQNWDDDMQRGLLRIDENKLIDALSNNPEAVRELFASDTNEDSIPDNGVAVNMQNMLRPYNTSAGGLISARIDLLRTEITNNKDEIRRKELSLNDKEQELRRRFGRMERAVNENRSMGQYLNRNIPQGN